MCLLSLKTGLDEILLPRKISATDDIFHPHSEKDCQILDVKGSGFRDEHIPVYVNPEINLGNVLTASSENVAWTQFCGG